MNAVAIAQIEDEETDDEAVVDAAPDMDDEPAEEPGLALYTSGEPPDDIDVDTAGLPPQRARLARFQAWVARTKAERDALETGRERFLESVGAPAVTEAKIAALIESDRLGLVSWMRSGAAGITQAQIRSFERQKLEEALADDRHAVEVAKAALAEVEREIRDKRQHVEALEQRRGAFAEAAVVEVVEAIGAQYRRQAEEMRETLAQLLGANNAIGALGYMENPPRDVTAKLPSFKLRSLGNWRDFGAGFGIKVGKREIQQASGPWRDLLRLWADDARAAPPSAAPEPALTEPENEPAPLAPYLQSVVDAITDEATGRDWDDIAMLVADRITLLRCAAECEDGPFSEYEVPTLIAALIETIDEPTVVSSAQARLFGFSADSAHHIAAATWFEAHPDDRPADGADIVDALS